MIILHAYSSVMVDHIGFKGFCAIMQLLFNVISRNTIKADIMKLYKEERERLRQSYCQKIKAASQLQAIHGLPITKIKVI